MPQNTLVTVLDELKSVLTDLPDKLAERLGEVLAANHVTGKNQPKEEEKVEEPGSAFGNFTYNFNQDFSKLVKSLISQFQNLFSAFGLGKGSGGAASGTFGTIASGLLKDLLKAGVTAAAAGAAAAGSSPFNQIVNQLKAHNLQNMGLGNLAAAQELDRILQSRRQTLAQKVAAAAGKILPDSWASLKQGIGNVGQGARGMATAAANWLGFGSGTAPLGSAALQAGQGMQQIASGIGGLAAVPIAFLFSLEGTIKALDVFSKGLENTNKQYALWNGRIGSAFAIAAMRDISRTIEVGHRVQGTATSAIFAEQQAEDAMVPHRVLAQNFMNQVSRAASSLKGGLANSTAWIANAANWVIASDTTSEATQAGLTVLGGYTAGRVLQAAATWAGFRTFGGWLFAAGVALGVYQAITSWGKDDASKYKGFSVWPDQIRAELNPPDRLGFL